LLLILLPRDEFSGGGNNQHEERGGKNGSLIGLIPRQFCDSSVSLSAPPDMKLQQQPSLILICQGRPIRNAFENEPNGGLAGRDSDRREHSADTTAVGG
jgi:hypothetical protein